MRSFRQIAGGGALVLAGFVAGWVMQPAGVDAQVAPKPVKPKVKVDKDKLKKNPWARDDGLPSFAYHTLQSQMKYPTKSGETLEIGWSDIPGFKGGASEERFRKLDYLDVVRYDYNNGNARAGVRFFDVEKWRMSWIDFHDTNGLEKIERNTDTMNWYAGYCDTDDEYWKAHFPSVVVLPPPDRDGRVHEYTWEITRHENGRVKTLTPYIGETEKRMHGWRLVYNDDGNLLSMTPYVNGKRHGIERKFDGTSRSRVQAPESTVRWKDGLRVIGEAVPNPEGPGPKRVPGK